MRIITHLSVFAAALLLTAPGLAQQDDGDQENKHRWASNTTLENLQEAYNGEMNANAKYLEYAKKAEQEGYMPVASLFRAAARAERIHAGNHATVIRALGGKPKAEVKLPAIKSTKDNLLAAVAGESYERDMMYPAIMKKARDDRNRDAMRSFNFARTAEAEHAKLYKYAADHLEQFKSKDKATYMVCTTCGYTVKKADFTFSNCPSCFDPKEKYVAVD